MPYVWWRGTSIHTEGGFEHLGIFQSSIPYDQGGYLTISKVFGWPRSLGAKASPSTGPYSTSIAALVLRSLLMLAASSVSTPQHNIINKSAISSNAGNITIYEKLKKYTIFKLLVEYEYTFLLKFCSSSVPFPVSVYRCSCVIAKAASECKGTRNCSSQVCNKPWPGAPAMNLYHEGWKSEILCLKLVHCLLYISS